MTKLHEVVENIKSGTIRSDIPEIKIGDLVRVGVAIQEGNKERIQPFEGTVISRHLAGSESSITIRKTLQGIGVERVFPLHAPCLKSIEVLRRAEVARAKLYYLRNRTGKATRLKQKFETLPKPWKTDN
ncbi:hypothetical protein PSENEW3_10000032 (chloroplast) [Picochlorum sp. SENEW3]|jgi:large subunit ribosomal protein L19|nr:ribosomal protein L19 [Picochlorum sp. BH-2019]WPT18762.1 hypothetical protein PSENEW3_10000032 [Picochlorum sp. SENEW3]